MGDVILFKEDVDRLNALLRIVVNDARLLSALLITKDTRVLACHGPTYAADPGALAALLVGSFASTQAIAGLIGEAGFDTLSHCGKTRSVFICNIDDETIIACIFDKNSSNDRIHASVLKHSELLKKVLHLIGSNTTNDLFDLGASGASSADIGDEIAMRADALSKGVGPEERESPADSQRMTEEPELSPAQAPIMEDRVLNEIKRPPEREVVPKGQSHHHENVGDVSSPMTKAADDEAAGRMADMRPSFRDGKENHPEKEIHASPHFSAAPDEKDSTDALPMPIPYLKNKMREGALYYHYDKMFFKKFFKSSQNKKT
jgi:hypothetical protein